MIDLSKKIKEKIIFFFDLKKYFFDFFLLNQRNIFNFVALI